MGRLIEKKEYQRPEWEAFTWTIDGQRISGFVSVVEEGEWVRKVRLAIGIPNDAQVVRYGSVTKSPIDREPKTGRPIHAAGPEEMIEVSWWSSYQKVGRHILIPCELALAREDFDQPLRIQVVDVALYGHNNQNNPTVKDIG